MLLGETDSVPDLAPANSGGLSRGGGIEINVSHDSAGGGDVGGWRVPLVVARVVGDVSSGTIAEVMPGTKVDNGVIYLWVLAPQT